MEVLLSHMCESMRRCSSYCSYKENLDREVKIALSRSAGLLFDTLSPEYTPFVLFSVSLVFGWSLGKYLDRVLRLSSAPSLQTVSPPIQKHVFRFANQRPACTPGDLHLGAHRSLDFEHAYPPNLETEELPRRRPLPRVSKPTHIWRGRLGQT